MDITEKEKNKHNRIIISIIISFCAVLIVYFGMAAFFTNHFYFGSEINCISVSGKTVEEAKEQMTSELKKYALNLKERGGKSEQIRGCDIAVKYNSGGEYKRFKDSQNPFKWVSAVFNSKNSKMTDELSYDAKLLKERVDKLSCFQTNNIIEPKNASFKYTDKGYVITGEISGNKVNKDILYEHVSNAILKGETTIDFESIDCYVKPQYTSKSPKVIENKNTLNKYISSNITYNFGESKETIDNSIINKWLKVNENLEITFDNERLKADVNVIFNKHNTIGKTRNFVTTSGKTISICGGDYGWLIDADKEIKELSADIKKGQTITKEPTYIQKALVRGDNDIGNTYVEIDMSDQHLWFYKNGSLIIEGDVVTGNLSRNHSTPIGIYSLKYKQRNAVLRGPGYSSPVNFWMPFNGGIGIHDASWRGEFGGTIYRTSGSHGCINSPYYLAKKLFNNVEEGTPVICYY